MLEWMNYQNELHFRNFYCEADVGLNFHWMTSSQGAIEKGFVYM